MKDKTKKRKKSSYMKKGQATKKSYEELEKKQKAREREKRIKERNKDGEKEEFDLETEMVIQMTNKNNMKKEANRRKEIDKKQRKIEKRNKRIKLVFKILVFLGLICGTIAFALTSPIFNIKNIKVINNSEVPEDTIISLSELKPDESIFKFYSKNVIKKIKQNPYIKNAKIHRKIPNSIEIEVEERQAKYSVDYMGKYAYINNQGYILEISENSKELTIIQGISTNEEDVVPGNRLNNNDLSKLEDVIKILNTANENEVGKKVTFIDITDEKEYIIYLGDEKKKIHLGDATNLTNKMLYVTAIMEKEKNIEGEIYVNGDLNNKFQPYFREKV